MALEIDSLNKNYIIKFSILISATIIGMIFVWWILVREESVNWISGQFIHQPNQYFISKMFDGRFEVVNVMRGFTIVSPVGWSAEDERNPVFYFLAEEKKICEISTEWINAKKTAQMKSTGVLGEQITLSSVAGSIDGWKKEIKNQTNQNIYQINLPVDIAILRLDLNYQSGFKETCLSGLDELIASFQR